MRTRNNVTRNVIQFNLILDELGPPKLEKRESNIDFLNVPSTSKSLTMTSEDELSNKPNKDLKKINDPLLFLPKSNKSGENDLFSRVSSSRKSDLSDESFSENSFDFSTEKDLSCDNSDSSTTGLLAFLITF